MSLVRGGDAGVELRERGAESGMGCRGSVGADGHEQREETAAVACGIDVQPELGGMGLRALLVGLEDAGPGAWNGDGAGEVGVVGAEDVKALAECGALV